MSSTQSNRLIDEVSPYLLQHARNPVAWYPWGEDAFKAARRENKPVFLSVGYATCHWCHVMAHESFEDPETAQLINERYIPVKVDREEYPDVDGYYISFLTQLTGQGGWPLNVFLNPHRAPFYGITYQSAPKLRELLRYVSDEYKKNETVRTQRISTEFGRRAIDPDEARRVVSSIDFPEPSSTKGPQFPQGLYLAYAASQGRFDMVEKELQDLVLKGLFDHIEGGWFRYSVDPQWKIPHFEKMLYDQATMLTLCAEVHDELPELSSYAVGATVSWLTNHMRLPNGLYGSATDADTDEGEGVYYTFDDIDSQYEVELFRLADCGVHEGRHLPWLDLNAYKADPERAEAAIKSRAEARADHTAPGLDGKAVFSWNALLAYALFKCYRALGDETLHVLATGLLNALRNQISGDVPHAVYQNGPVRGNRYLQDYAAYLLALSEAKIDSPELADEADEILKTVEQSFAEGDELWNTTEPEFESQSLWQDTPFPSGGSMLLNALAALGRRDHRLTKLLFTNISLVAAEHPVFFAYWCTGFTRYFEG